MIRNIVIFGGAWAATATSVVLVRKPYTEEPLEDGEVETLDPRDFTSKAGEDAPFASKYPNYFAATTTVNKKFWEDRFNNKKSKDKDKIVIGQAPNPTLEIVSALDDPENKTRGISLVSFCREGYYAKSIFINHHHWDFSPSSSPYWDLEYLSFWSLCSVFGSKPETLCDVNDDAEQRSYSAGTIGNEIHKSLVRTDVSHDFWDIREQEWQVTNVRDSKYFGNHKKKDHSIKDLCSAAYEITASNIDTDYVPSADTAARYCRLEWTWD